MAITVSQRMGTQAQMTQGFDVTENICWYKGHFPCVFLWFLRLTVCDRWWEPSSFAWFLICRNQGLRNWLPTMNSLLCKCLVLYHLPHLYTHLLSSSSSTFWPFTSNWTLQFSFSRVYLTLFGCGKLLDVRGSQIKWQMSVWEWYLEMAKLEALVFITLV